MKLTDFSNSQPTLFSKHKVLSLWAVTLAYVLAFAVVYQLSTFWATSRLYSIWFPAAGVRFAALWLCGPEVAPLFAIAEFAALVSIGALDGVELGKPLLLGSILSPCLAYGASIAVVKRLRFNSSTLKRSTLRAAAATAIAPVVAFAVNAPWYIVANEPGFSASPASVLSNGVVFVVGDLLGILLVTPPVLALLRALRHRRRPNIGSPAEWAGTAVLLAFGGTIVWAIKLGGYGIRLLPLILAVGAIGVMYGRVHAWVSVVLASGAVLWVTAGPAFDAGELALHLQLTGLVLLGLIAGSYADDQRNMRAELRIRDSALLHAERLKTLRAMSVAVIHELSQPLSTLSIETRYLAKLSNSPESDPEELRTVSALIAQKTENLADMLRRLRNFGAASAEESMIVELEKMVRDVVGIIAPEARSAGVRIVMRLKRDLRVFGRGVELQQALTNLLRNAIAASPGGTVRLVTEATAESVRIEVVNTPTPDSPYQKGMGVGKLIVEAIAEMHGGALVEHHAKCGERRIGLVLPTTRVSGT